MPMSTHAPSARRGRAAIALAACMAVAACSGGGSSAPPGPADRSTAPTSTTDPATAGAWAEIDQRLAAMAPEVGFLAARVGGDGSCDPVHAVEPATARPMGSQLKLYVLGALAEEVAAGRVAWDQPVTVEEDDQSFGNGEGSLQEVEPGTDVPVEEAALKMISISDNTATDVLIDLVGREAVEGRVAALQADPEANVPFLTTREMFLLHYVPGLAEEWLATPREERAAFLASSVDPRPLSDIFVGLTPEPRFVDSIEWFGSPEDLCVAFSALRDQAADPALAPLDAILSEQVAGIGLDAEDWSTVWYKGGSEPGVLAMGWLATTRGGDTYVVQGMLLDTEEALGDDTLTGLRDLAADAFALLAQTR